MERSASSLERRFRATLASRRSDCAKAIQEFRDTLAKSVVIGFMDGYLNPAIKAVARDRVHLSLENMLNDGMTLEQILATSIDRLLDAASESEMDVHAVREWTVLIRWLREMVG